MVVRLVEHIIMTYAILLLAGAKVKIIHIVFFETLKKPVRIVIGCIRYSKRKLLIHGINKKRNHDIHKVDIPLCKEIPEARDAVGYLRYHRLIPLRAYAGQITISERNYRIIILLLHLPAYQALIACCKLSQLRLHRKSVRGIPLCL